MMATLEMSSLATANFTDDVIPLFLRENVSSYATLEGFVTLNQYLMVMRCSVGIRLLLCLTGLVGNVINIRTFLRMGLEDAVTIAFFNLAISDFMILLSVLAGTIAGICEILEHDFPITFEVPPKHAQIYPNVVGRMFSDVTILLTTFLAIQRCLCVFRPFHFKGIFTRFRTFMIVLVIWIYCLTCGLLHLSQYTITRRTLPSTNTSVFIVLTMSMWDTISTYLRTVNGVAMNVSCQAILLISVNVMAHALRKSVQFRQSASNGTRKDTTTSELDKTTANDATTSSTTQIGNSKERQAIVQVAIVSTIFLATNIPFLVTSIAEIIEPQLAAYHKYHYTFLAYYDAKLTLDSFNSAVNFVVYFNYNTKFRQLCFSKTIKT